MEGDKNSWFLSRVPDDVPRFFPRLFNKLKRGGGGKTEAEMVLLPRNLGTIAVERISGIEPWPRHAPRIPLNSFVRFTIRFIPSRDRDKEGWRNGRSRRCDDRHILSPMGILSSSLHAIYSTPFRPSMIFPIRDAVPFSFSNDFSSLRCLLIDRTS